MNLPLEEDLKRVKAPKELWDRVEVPRPEKQPARWNRGWNLGLTWAAAAAVVVGVMFVPQQLSGRIQTNDPNEIRTWVENKTGLVVPIKAGSPGITFEGARKTGAHSATIMFNADSAPSVLHVKPAAPGSQSHVRPEIGSHSTTWVLHGQSYTLETPSPAALETACRLCHG